MIALNCRKISGGSGEAFPPGNVTSFAAASGNGTVTLKWSDPNDSVFEGMLISEWKGTKILRKTGGYPANENDGILVVNNTTRNQYAATGFEDSGLENGVTYYYQAFPYSTKGAVNRNDVNRVVATPLDVFVVSMLPIGALVKDINSKYYGVSPIFKIADHNHPGFPTNSATLIADRIPTLKAYDAKEPSNSNTPRQTAGNARYSYSNIRQWFNSDKAANAWYAAQHSADAPPIAANLYLNHNPYVAEAGFLSGFSTAFKAALLPTTLTVAKHSIDGGGSETVTDKVFLPSIAELGLIAVVAEYQTPPSFDEGSKLALFSNDDSSRIAYPTAEAVGNSTYKNANLSEGLPYQYYTRTPNMREASPSGVFGIGVAGEQSALNNSTWMGTHSVRPLCNIPANTRVSSTPDSDGAYILLF